jgi:hypothetical protein
MCFWEPYKMIWIIKVSKRKINNSIIQHLWSFKVLFLFKFTRQLPQLPFRISILPHWGLSLMSLHHCCVSGPAEWQFCCLSFGKEVMPQLFLKQFCCSKYIQQQKYHCVFTPPFSSSFLLSLFPRWKWFVKA